MYQQIGTIAPQVVASLAARLGMFDLDLSGTGYGSTSDRHELVKASFQPDVGYLFPGEWSYCMLAVVYPNGGIPPHKDGPLKAGYRRYHVVLQTNENSWTLHGGEWQQLEAGGIFVMEPTETHAAINWGAEPRIHLVIDCPEAL